MGALAGLYKLFWKKHRIVRRDGRLIDLGLYVLNALKATQVQLVENFLLFGSKLC